MTTLYDENGNTIEPTGDASLVGFCPYCWVPGAMPTRPLRACAFIRRKQRRVHTITRPTRRSACFVRENLILRYWNQRMRACGLIQATY